ncbi:MAG: hypothetical protein R3C70_09755 [Geminicoccaceae bacterium]
MAGKRWQHGCSVAQAEPAAVPVIAGCPGLVAGAPHRLYDIPPLAYISRRASQREWPEVSGVDCRE